MFYILKGLYFNYKLHTYDKAVIKLTADRAKLKAKQVKCTERCEYYLALTLNKKG